MDIRKKFLGVGKTIRDAILYDKYQKIHLQFLKDFGEDTLRLDYDFLTEDSVVFDLGGYRGQSTSDLFSKYGPNMYVFEPVEEYADFLRKRFARRSNKIKIFQFGLGSRTEEQTIKLEAEGSSTYKSAGDTSIHIEDFMEFVKREKIEKIDLLEINIEGGEYDVLPYLIETGYIKNIRALQIQFHNLMKDAPQRVAKIREGLAKTHVCDYSYDFSWDGWTLKK
jgi:FkbM family methyltransferase